MIKRALLFLIAVACLVPIRSWASADFLSGYWLVQDKDAVVEFYRHSGKYFGRFVWFKEPNDNKGDPLVDEKNPDPKLQGRPLLGMTFIKDLVEEPDGHKWKNGFVYAPDRGKTYGLEVSRTKSRSDLIQIHGFIGISLFGGSETWSRLNEIPAKNTTEVRF